MGKILARALAPLGGIFGLEGSQVSTDELDLSSVQLVSEVNGIAGYSQGPGINFGRAVYQAHQDYTVSANIAETIDAYSPAETLGGWSIPATHDLWAVGAYVFSGDAAQAYSVLDVAGIALDYPATYVGAIDAAAAQTSGEHYLFLGNSFVSTVASGPLGVVNQLPDLNRPVWIPRGTSILFKSRTSGAGNLNLALNLIVQALPKAISP